MRAAIIDAPGAEPRLGDFPEPEAADGGTALTMLAAGIHQVVRRLAAGTHYGSGGAYPLIPGVDGVGRDAEGTPRYAAGVRSPWGTLAERAVARLAIPVPDGADPSRVAGAMNPGMSSWLPLTERAAGLDRLGTVLVVGATGVAGRLAVQNAFALGAERVVGLGRDAERLAEVARLGAVAVDLADGDAALQRALGDAVPSLVLDFVWGAAAELVWAALGRHGLGEDEADILHVEIGGTGGPSAALPAALLRSRRITIRGSGAGSGSVADVMAQLPVYLSKVAAGEVVAPIRVFPLSRLDEAWAYRGPDRAVVAID